MQIHLIGGGPGAMLATRRHLHDAVKSVGKKRALVAYVGAASDDNSGFMKMLGAAFVGTGAHLELARLVKKSASTTSARQLLEDSDVIFLSGGDVEHGMNVLRERGVDEDLRRLFADGKPFMGVSAGSIMACQDWVRFEDDDDDKAEPFACLGLAPLHMDAHSEDDDWSELRVLVRLLARRDGEALGYGVPSGGCLRVTLEGKKAKLTAMGAPIARIAAKERQSPEDKAPLLP